MPRLTLIGFQSWLAMSYSLARLCAWSTICVLCIWPVRAADVKTSIRDIDFRNFTYPWKELNEWPDHMKWLTLEGSKQVKLANGRWALPQEDVSDPPFSGLTLDEVVYGKLLGDQRDDAVVVLRFDTGGTMYYYYIYIYTTESGRLKLLAYFHTGDRSSFGLYRIYVQRKTLVVELYDPMKQEGDCCSSGFERVRYEWRKSAFAEVGSKESGVPTVESRRPVSVFGLPRR